jgi:rhodanese-related sulfurtransferase
MGSSVGSAAAPSSPRDERCVGVFARAAVLALAGAALGFGVNGVRNDRVDPAAFAAPTSCQMAAEAPVERLAPTAAAALCGDPGTVVADARPADRFEQGHVAGALHLPCAASGAVARDGLAALAGKRTVVVYGDNTEEALLVADGLRRAGAGLRVAVLEGGFPAWSAAGLACSSGPCAACTTSSAVPAPKESLR